MIKVNAHLQISSPNWLHTLVYIAKILLQRNVLLSPVVALGQGRYRELKGQCQYVLNMEVVPHRCITYAHQLVEVCPRITQRWQCRWHWPGRFLTGVEGLLVLTHWDFIPSEISNRILGRFCIFNYPSRDQRLWHGPVVDELLRSLLSLLALLLIIVPYIFKST
jgi:hypothetical protein